MSTDTFYWHDYETFGIDPVRDRPVQFAGVRTDSDLNPIGEPLMVFCKQSPDYLPNPQACLVTGITPQQAEREGVCEAEFIQMIHAELARPGTCSVGYNSIRFDDEVTRNTLYRNFYDPYAREWQNGNSRWDLIDVLRLARALRPEGIEWPTYADGTPSLRLEDLSAANGLMHESAHDALSDVYATIAVAKLIKEKQPRLFEYALRLRDKRYVATQLDVIHNKPVLHVSSKYSAERSNLAVVAPLAMHPINRNGVIVYDLETDPTPLLSLTAAEIRQRVFTRADQLPAGVERIPLKVLHLNRSPMIAPATMLTPEEAERLKVSGRNCRHHLAMLRGSPALQQKLQEVFAESDLAPQSDPDNMLYSGGFFSPQDRASMDRVRECEPALLSELELPFQDARLEEMLFRYRARNYPETLGAEEQERWEQFRSDRLASPATGVLGFEAFYALLNELGAQYAVDSDEMLLLQELATYAESIYPF